VTRYLVNVAITVVDADAAFMNATLLGEPTHPAVEGTVTLQVDADTPPEALEDALGRIRAAAAGDAGDDDD
jgi:hypothetical protein